MGRCPTPRVRHVAGVQGTAFGLKPQHPTTGTSAAPVQRQGFGFAPVLAILTRSHSLRSLALRLPGCSGLALDPAPPLTCWRLFGFGMEKVSRAAPEAAAERKGEALSTERVRMQAKRTLDAFGMTHAPVMGVGGLRPKAVPLHP